MICTPGAKKSISVLELENNATVSVSSVAPTVIAVEMQPGELTALVKPSLPEAITVAILADLRLSIAGLRASLSQAEVKLPPPMLMFAAAMPKVLRSANTRSSPASWSESNESAHGSSPWPAHEGPSKRENTWIEISRACRATPENEAPLPAAMPATWVPCLHADGA